MCLKRGPGETPAHASLRRHGRQKPTSPSYSLDTKTRQKIYKARATRAMCCLRISGIMYDVRESWTDARLDDLRGEVNRRFDEVDRRFYKVEGELHRLNDHFAALNRTLLQIGGGVIATMIAGA